MTLTEGVYTAAAFTGPTAVAYDDRSNFFVHLGAIMRGTLLTRLGFFLLIIPFVYLIGMTIVDRSAWWTADESAQQLRAAFLYGCLVAAALLGVIEWFRQRGTEDGRRRAGAVILIFACMVAFFPITAVIYAPVIRDLPARAQTETELKQIYEAIAVYAAQSPEGTLPDGDAEDFRLTGDAWTETAGDLAEPAREYVYLMYRVANEQEALELLADTGRSTRDSNAPDRARLPQSSSESNLVMPGSYPLLFEPYDWARGGGNVLYLDGRVEIVRRPAFPYTDALIQAVEEMRAGN